MIILLLIVFILASVCYLSGIAVRNQLRSEIGVVNPWKESWPVILLFGAGVTFFLTSVSVMEDSHSRKVTSTITCNKGE